MTFRERPEKRTPPPPGAIEPVYAEVGARIRWLRQQRDWNRQEFADRMGVNVATGTAWELGKSRVKLNELVRIAHVFGVSLEVFLADLRVEDAETAERQLNARRKQVITRKKTQAAKTAAKTKPKTKK